MNRSVDRHKLRWQYYTQAKLSVVKRHWLRYIMNFLWGLPEHHGSLLLRPALFQAPRWLPFQSSWWIPAAAWSARSGRHQRALCSCSAVAECAVSGPEWSQPESGCTAWGLVHLGNRRQGRGTFHALVVNSWPLACLQSMACSTAHTYNITAGQTKLNS